MSGATVPHVERAYNLLETRGPATAYDYVQQVGIEFFPVSLVNIIRHQVWTRKIRCTLKPKRLTQHRMDVRKHS